MPRFVLTTSRVYRVAHVEQSPFLLYYFQTVRLEKQMSLLLIDLPIAQEPWKEDLFLLIRYRFCYIETVVRGR